MFTLLGSLLQTSNYVVVIYLFALCLLPFSVRPIKMYTNKTTRPYCNDFDPLLLVYLRSAPN